MKESHVLPKVRHLEQTDLALTDPVFTAVSEGKCCAHCNGNDVYLVNSALWLRFLARIDRNNGEPAFC